MDSKINGYLELNGSIFKISSIDDLKKFVSRVGKEMEEMTQTDFITLCEADYSRFVKHIYDDCQVRYSEDRTFLVKADSFCCSLEEYKIAENTICVINHAFHIDKVSFSIKHLSMPNSVIATGANSFYNCRQLQTIIISDNLQFIGTCAFYGCSNLISFDFPESLKYIESEAFCGCSSLSSITLPHQLRLLGSHAFKDCSSLKTICFNSQDIEIGSGVFEGCSSLEKIIIPKGCRNKYEAMLPFNKEKLIENE